MGTKKRGQNEPSIYRRSDGRWCASLTVGYRSGKQIRKAVYGSSREEVASRLASLQRAKVEGIPASNDRITTEQFLRQWLVTVEPNVAYKTYVSYEQIVRLHLIPCLGKTPLAKLSVEKIQAFLNNKLRDREISARTVAYTRRLLSMALKKAVVWNLCPRNNAVLTDAIKVPAFKIEPMAPDDARRILEAIRGHRWEAVFIVALASGMRAGEVLALHWKDVDLKEGILFVRQKLQRQNGKLTLDEPKSEHSKRYLRLPQVAIQALKAHRSAQNQLKLLAGEKWKGTDFIFTTSIGTPIDICNLDKEWLKILQGAELPRIRIHDLRHGFATLLLAKGANIKTISDALGHSQVSFTLKTYAHVGDALKQEAADKMDQVLGLE